MKQGSLITLMFHGIVEKMPDYCRYYATRDCHIRLSDFEKMIRYCTDHYRILGIDDLPVYLSGNAKEDGVLITFDDGLESLYTLGVPVLKKYNARATVFLTSGWIDNPLEPSVFALERVIYEHMPVTATVSVKDCFWEADVRDKKSMSSFLDGLWTKLLKTKTPPLSLQDDHITINGKTLDHFPVRMQKGCWSTASWQMLSQAYAEGILEIGAHGATHIPWSWLSDEELERELSENRSRILQKLGMEVVSCSYPHGLRNENTKHVVQKYFKYAFANVPVVPPDHMELSRLHVPYHRPNSLKWLTQYRRQGDIVRKMASAIGLV
jgi:peptidoglycan/xylan/chitin deacetylase (PgdA/CDA1 family)